MQKEYSGKSLEDALAIAGADLGVDPSTLKYQKMSENGFLGLFKSTRILVTVPKETTPEPTPVEVEEKETNETVENVNIMQDLVETIKESTDSLGKSTNEAADVAKEFVSGVLTKMGLEAEVTASLDMVEETVFVDIVGPDMGVLIGKRGQTLDSLQYLASLVVNRACTDMYLKVKLDTENYRARRKETLENLAKNISQKVRRSHRPVALEPMNPYERRLIHSALQNDKYVETHSEGDEPYRHVVVTMRKDAPQDNKYRGNNRNGYRGGRGNGGKYRNNYYDKKKPAYPKYNDKSDDYSTDYKADYAAYLEQKAAAKAASENNKPSSII